MIDTPVTPEPGDDITNLDDPDTNGTNVDQTPTADLGDPQ